MKPKNKKKQTPIPGLARYLVWMNTKRTKLELATLRAELADKVYAASVRR